MFSLEKIMSDIGLNTGGIRNKELLLGKEIISSKDKNTVEEQAKAHKGSEVIYKGNDNLWHAKELKEEGAVYGTNNISVKDQACIKLNDEKLNKLGMKNAVISFVDSDKNSPEDIEKFAKDPLTPDATLKQYVENGKALSLVAENPNASVETIRELFKKAPGLDVFITKNPSAPPDMLEKIYNGGKADNFIKRHLSENKNTPPHILKELANDPNLQVKREVAGNVSTTSDVLKELYEFKSPVFGNKNDPFIELALAENTSTPVDILNNQSKTHNDLTMLITLARNNSVPQGTIREMHNKVKELAKTISHITISDFNEALLKNSNTPQDLIPILKKELSEENKKFPLTEIATEPNIPVGPPMQAGVKYTIGTFTVEKK